MATNKRHFFQLPDSLEAQAVIVFVHSIFAVATQLFKTALLHFITTMRLLKHSLPPFLASLLFLLLLFLTFPYYKFYIDPDAVAYLSITQRYAAGQWQQAVNGLWSPFHPFLASLFVRSGTDPLVAAHLTNALAGVGILFAAFALFRRFGLSIFQLWLLLMMLPFALIYFHYLQLFADAWLLFFLLLYLLVATLPDFTRRKWMWVLTALLGALAFYAKAYAFYFVLLHLAAVCFLSWRRRLATRREALFAWLFATVLLVALVAPWAYLINQKYGRISLGNAGVLNKTWFLTGQKEYRNDIQLLVPPAYEGSLTDWEDPWMSRGTLHHSFESPSFFGKQILLSGRAMLQLVKAFNELSPFLLATLLLTLFAAWSRKNSCRLNDQETILLAAAFLFPLGYLTLFVETRYIWLLIYPGIIFGMKWLDRAKGYLGPDLNRLSALIFVFSFLIVPFYGMSELLNRQKDAWIDAAALKSKKISGSFVSNHPHAGREWVLAWLTGNANYTLRPIPHTPDEMVAEMQRYRVKYFFDYTRLPCVLPELKLIDSTASMLIYENARAGN